MRSSSSASMVTVARHPIEDTTVTTASDLRSAIDAPAFEGRLLPQPDEPPYDQGLQFDVQTLVDRRRVLQIFGYGAATAGLMTLAACAPAASTIPGSAASAGRRTAALSPRPRSTPGTATRRGDTRCTARA
jgi:hypothetical protein